MSLPSESQVVPSPMLLIGLTQLLAASGPFHTLTLHLNQIPTSFSRGSDLTSVSEATFTGYTAVAGLTFSSPFYDVDGSALVVGADTAFIATGASPSNTIYGYYFSDAAVANLVAGYSFTTPVGIAAIGQAVVVVPFLRYSGD